MMNDEGCFRELDLIRKGRVNTRFTPTLILKGFVGANLVFAFTSRSPLFRRKIPACPLFSLFCSLKVEFRLSFKGYYTERRSRRLFVRIFSCRMGRLIKTAFRPAHPNLSVSFLFQTIASGGPGALFVKTAPGPHKNFLLKGSINTA
jgi:hypothetical protein